MRGSGLLTDKARPQEFLFPLTQRCFWASLGTYLQEENKNTSIRSLNSHPHSGTASSQEDVRNDQLCQVTAGLVYPLPKGCLQKSHHTPTSSYCCPGQQASANAFVSIGNLLLWTHAVILSMKTVCRGSTSAYKETPDSQRHIFHFCMDIVSW